MGLFLLMRLLLRMSFVLVLGALIVLQSSGAAARPFETLLPAARDYSQESYVIQQYVKRVVFNNDGTSETSERAVVRVQSAAAVRQFAILAFPFVERCEEVIVQDLNVKKADGRIVRTPASAAFLVSATVSQAASAYTDAKEKQIPVRALEAGDVLSYDVRTVRRQADVPGQFWFSENMLAGNVVFDDVLQISVPLSRAVKVLSPSFTPEINDALGVRTYTWRKKLLATSAEQQAARAGVLPPKWLLPDVQISSFQSWEEVGNWYRLLQNNSVQVTPAIRAKALELTRGLDSPEKKAQALYDFVATRFRYLEVAWGEGRFVPRPAFEILQNQYGDCKDKHTLYAALCKAVGIEAWPVLIGTGIELSDVLPTPAAFDHVMTVVSRKDGSLLWLDTTSDMAAFGLLAPQYRDEKALVIPSQTAALIVRTPAAPPMAFQQELVADATLDFSGRLRGHFSLTIRDESEAALRSIFRQMARAEWPQFVQKFSEGMGFRGQVSNVAVDDPEKLDLPFHFSYDYQCPSSADWETRGVSAPLYPLALPVPGNDLHSTDAFPIGVPETIHFRGRLTLPPSYIPDPPAAKHLEDSAVSYESRYSVAGSEVVAERTVVIRQATVSPELVDSYRNLALAAVRDAGLTVQIKSMVHQQPLSRPTDIAEIGRGPMTPNLRIRSRLGSALYR